MDSSRIMRFYIPHFSISFLLLILFSFFFNLGYGQLYTVSGRVTGSSIEPIAFVNVNVKDQVNKTITNEKGEFQFRLADGKYTLIFTAIGYKTIQRDVVVNKQDVYVTILLEEDATVLQDVDISAKYEDPARRVVRDVIRNKFKYERLSYQCRLYIIAIDSYDAKKINSVSIQKQVQDSLQKENDYSVDTDSARKSQPAKQLKKAELRMDMAEVIIRKSFEYPNKLKEERVAFKLHGRKENLFYLSSTEGEFNFYQNLVYCPSLSELPLQSPISTAGLLLYKYKTVKVFKENGLRIFRIHVEPSLMGNSLVSGEMEIVDSLFCVRNIDFTFPKYHLDEYTFFRYQADYSACNDSMYCISKMRFLYEAGSRKDRLIGETSVSIDSLKLQQVFTKRYFNNEVSTTLKEAYEKDSAFWNKTRSEPLNEKEIKFIHHDDSIRTAHSTKKFLDSIDKRENKITIIKVLFMGQGNYNRAHERRLSFAPLIWSYQPIGVGGARLSFNVGLSNKFPNKRAISLFPIMSYGIKNRDVNGSLNFYALYNLLKRAIVRVGVGKSFEVINNNDSWLNRLRTFNYYLNRNIYVAHRIELFNGLSWLIRTEYARRTSTYDLQNDTLTSWVFDNYKYSPIDFASYNAFYVENELSYTPQQKYIRDSYQKIILGSKYPTFSINHKYGIPKILNSSIDYQYLEFRIEQDIDMGTLGISKYRITSGEFFNKHSVKAVDYKYQPLLGFPFFGNPLRVFQGLEKSYSILDRFYTGHYFHRFNGAIINKIPFVKFLHLSETGGAGVLYSKENNLFYYEAYVGLEKHVRIFSDMFRIGAYFVSSKTNGFPYRAGIRFSIDKYDKAENKWSY